MSEAFEMRPLASQTLGNADSKYRIRPCQQSDAAALAAIQSEYRLEMSEIRVENTNTSKGKSEQHWVQLLQVRCR